MNTCFVIKKNERINHVYIIKINCFKNMVVSHRSCTNNGNNNVKPNWENRI